MKFGREKRLWLAALALLAPVPLPFNQVLEWPFFFVYALFVIHFLHRAERGAWITLSNWVLNLLGLAAIPFIAFDLRAALAASDLSLRKPKRANVNASSRVNGARSRSNERVSARRPSSSREVRASSFSRFSQSALAARKRSRFSTTSTCSQPP